MTLRIVKPPPVLIPRMSIRTDATPTHNPAILREIDVIEYSDQPPGFVLGAAKLGEAALNQTPYYLDMHRWIGHIWQPHNDTQLLPWEHEFKEMLLGGPTIITAIERFVNSFGDFFSYDVINKRPHPWQSNTENWRIEWRKIADAAIQGATDDTIHLNLNKYTSTAVEPLSKNPEKSSLALHPEGWAGLCWAFIARDKFDGVTYTRCLNPNGCDREIPSSSPFGGNKTKTCSGRCRQAKNRGGSGNG